VCFKALKGYSVLLTIYGSHRKKSLSHSTNKTVINYVIVNAEVSQFMLGFPVGFSFFTERVVVEKLSGN
jgi:hypothetical protein